jgi:hypothetical protein
LSRFVPSPAGYLSVPLQKNPLPALDGCQAGVHSAIAACSQQSEQINPYSSFKRAQGQADARHDGVPGALLLLGIHKVETVNGTSAAFRKVATAV